MFIQTTCAPILEAGKEDNIVIKKYLAFTIPFDSIKMG